MTKIYIATMNADQTEGRGPMIPIGYFTTRKEAKKAAKGCGVVGYGDGEVDAVQVFETFEAFQKKKKKNQ